MAIKGSIVSRILNSGFFSKIMGRAAGMARNKAVLLVLFQKGMKKMENRSLQDGIGEVRQQLFLLFRFVKAYATGAYRAVPMKSIVTVIGVLIYFVSPLDLIPDLLPVIGIADDVALIMWLFSTMEGEIEKFASWERETQTINIG